MEKPKTLLDIHRKAYPVVQPTVRWKYTDQDILDAFQKIINFFPDKVDAVSRIVDDEGQIFKLVIEKNKGALPVEESRWILLEAEWTIRQTGEVIRKQIVCPKLIAGRYFKISGVNYYPPLQSTDRALYLVKDMICLRTIRMPVQVKKLLRGTKDFFAPKDAKKVQMYQLALGNFFPTPVDIMLYFCSEVYYGNIGRSEFVKRGFEISINEVMKYMGVDPAMIQLENRKQVAAKLKKDEYSPEYLETHFCFAVADTVMMIADKRLTDKYETTVALGCIYHFFKKILETLKTFRVKPESAMDNPYDYKYMDFRIGRLVIPDGSPDDRSVAILNSVHRLLQDDLDRILETLDIPIKEPSVFDIIWWMGSTEKLARQVSDLTGLTNKRFIWIELLLRAVAEVLAKSEYLYHNTPDADAKYTTMIGKMVKDIDPWMVVNSLKPTVGGGGKNPNPIAYSGGIMNFHEVLQVNMGPSSGRISEKRHRVSPSTFGAIDGISPGSVNDPGRTAYLSLYAKIPDIDNGLLYPCDELVSVLYPDKTVKENPDEK